MCLFAFAGERVSQRLLSSGHDVADKEACFVHKEQVKQLATGASRPLKLHLVLNLYHSRNISALATGACKKHALTCFPPADQTKKL